MAALAGAMRRAAVSAIGLLVSAALLLTSLRSSLSRAIAPLAEAIGSIHAPLVVGAAYLVFALVALLIVQSLR